MPWLGSGFRLLVGVSAEEVVALGKVLYLQRKYMIYIGVLAQWRGWKSKKKECMVVVVGHGSPRLTANVG